MKGRDEKYHGAQIIVKFIGDEVIVISWIE